jgi:hypothetical protein
MFKGALTLTALITAASVAASPALAGNIIIVGGHVTPTITPRVAVPATPRVAVPATPRVAVPAAPIARRAGGDRPIKYMEFKLKEVLISSVH